MPDAAQPTNLARSGSGVAVAMPSHSLCRPSGAPAMLHRLEAAPSAGVTAGVLALALVWALVWALVLRQAALRLQAGRWARLVCRLPSRLAESRPCGHE